MYHSTLRRLVGAGLAGLISITAALAVSFLGSVPASAAGPRPLFQLPVACGETWRLSTYIGHDYYDIDMTPTSGSAWGRPIYSSYAGRVVAAGISGTLGGRTPDNPDGPMGTGGGYYVKIDHGDGWQTLYLHMLEPPMVRSGQTVRQGHQLGKVGSTGRSSGPHIHYEQLRDGQKTQSYFNGVPSGITHDNANYSVTRVSYNCANIEVGRAHAVSVSAGKIHHTLRYPNGAWTPWGALNNAGTATSVSAAADGPGNLQVSAIIDGVIHHRIRYTDGSWTNWGTLGPASQVATSIDRTANVMHMAAVISGTIHHRIRWTDGSWSNWTNVGPGTHVAISVDHAHNILQMTGIIGGKLHHRVRNTDGTWTNFVAIDERGTVTSATVAADHNGNTQVADVVGGTIYHRIRYADGSWSTWAPIGSGTTITASVDVSRNNLQAMTIINGAAHHRVRNTDGTWTNWHPYTPSNTVTDISISLV